MAEMLSSFHLVVTTLSALAALVHEIDETFSHKLFFANCTHCLLKILANFRTPLVSGMTVNSMAYVALFVAIRNGDWLLRIPAIKLMAAAFHAFDRLIYQQLIPSTSPFAKRAISVHLIRSNGGAVALDEAHEMKIICDAKFAVVRPTEEFMERISNFMPFRAQCASYT